MTSRNRFSKPLFSPINLERLECRATPAAGITAALVGNQLQVLGTQGHDNIQFQNQNGKLSITGITQTFNLVDLSSILIDSGAGNDTIRINTEILPGNDALTLPRTNL